MRVFQRLVRTLAWSTGGVGGVYGVYVLHKNDYDVSSIGAVRLTRAAVAATRIVADYKWTAWRSGDEAAARSAVHRRSAERLLRLVHANGGVWIKVGQHVATLEYLLPQEYMDTLSSLYAQCPQSTYAEVCRVIEADLGVPVERAFASFEREPVASASLAQVHRATTTDGRRAAVKVQHPRVKPHSLVDMAAMEALVRCVAVLFPEFRLLWLAEELKRNLPRELNFTLEGEHAERVRRMFGHLDFLKVPEIYWDVSAGRVLSMEFCEGHTLTEVDYMRRERIGGRDVCAKLGRLYSEMIFAQGYVHCDPHPGNVLVRRDPKRGVQIVLLDHGLYQTLHDEFRVNYANLWLSILGADVDAIRHWATALGVGDLYGLFACMLTARSWRSVTSGVHRSSVSADETAEIQAYAGSMLAQIADILDRLPRSMLLILKTNDLLRGVEYRLGAANSADGFVQMAKRCVHTVYEQRARDCTGLACRLRVLVGRCWAIGRILAFQYFAPVLRLFAVNDYIQLV